MDYEEVINSEIPSQETSDLRSLLALPSKQSLSADQINQIIGFLQQFPSLLKYINNENYQNTILRDIAFNLKYRRINMGEIFIQQGEKFHNFYLVVSGSFSLFAKKSQEQYNQELNWYKVYTNTKQLLNSEQSESLNQIQIMKLKEQIQKSEGFLKVLQTPIEDQKLLLPHQEFYKQNQNLCMYKYVDEEVKQLSCLGDVYDTNLVSPHLMVANVDSEIVYLPQESYTKLFASSIQQLSFIFRTLEKLLSNGYNKSEIQKMSRLFKEKIVSGLIFKEQDESKEIFIVKKGVVVIKKGDLKIGEVQQGKVFGHENALSDQDRTITAHTKDNSQCIIYSVAVVDLCEASSLELLKNLMKQGRKKLEQYQEASFKFHQPSEGNRNQNLKMYKIDRDDNIQRFQPSSNNIISNPSFVGKQNRSQSSHVPSRPLKNQSPTVTTASFIPSPLTVLQKQNTEIKEIEIQSNEQSPSQKILERKKSSVEKSPQSTQTVVSCIANPNFQTTHQIQTSGLIITMVNKSYQQQHPPFHQQNQNQSQGNYLSHQSSLNNTEADRQSEGQEMIQSQYNSNKSEYQMHRFYSQTSKRVQTSGLAGGENRKVLSRRSHEQKESANQPNTKVTDQSWFVIKRLSTPSKAKKTQSEAHSRQSSNALSPSSNYFSTHQSKEMNTLSNIMTMMTKNTEEQESSPLKQRATLTSYIKQRNGQNGQTVFSSLSKQPQTNPQISQTNNYILLQQEHNTMKESIQNYIKTEDREEHRKSSEQISNHLSQKASQKTTPLYSLGSYEEDDDRLDFNLQSKYQAKKNLIQQSKYSTQVTTQNNSQIHTNPNFQSNQNAAEQKQSDMPIEINEYTSVNTKNNTLYGNPLWNGNHRQVATKNIYYLNQPFEKTEKVPSLVFQKRPSSNLSYNQPKFESQNHQFTKYQIMNSQKRIQKQVPSKINIVSSVNVQNYEELVNGAQKISRSSSPQLFNNTMLSRKLEKSQDTSLSSQLQRKVSDQQQQNSPSSSEKNTQDGNSFRKISFGSLSNASGLMQLKRSILQSPDIYKISDFIQENQFQDDQFSKSRDSERLKTKEPQKTENIFQKPLIQYNGVNLKIKQRTNSYHNTTNKTNSIQTQQNRDLNKQMS